MVAENEEGAQEEKVEEEVWATIEQELPNDDGEELLCQLCDP